MAGNAPAVHESNPSGYASATNTDDAATLNSSFLEFLTDELVFGSAEALDSATLEAVCQVANTQQQACGGVSSIKPDAQQAGALGPSLGSMKRSFEDTTYSDSDEEDEGGKGEKSLGKRPKGEMSAAATKKACREKARREKLNERFLDLARLVDPGNEPKTDKNTILTDAIKFVQQMTVENHQLRQLNKFLEERVSALERERGQQLYQQSLMMSAMGQGQMMAGGQPMLMGAPSGMMAAQSIPGASMPHPQLAMPVTAMAASASNPLLAAAGNPSVQPAGQSAQQPPQQPQQTGAPGGLMAHAASAGLMGQPGTAMLAPAPGTLMAQAPGGMMTQMGIPAGAAGAAAGMTYSMGVSVGMGAHMAATSAGAGPSKPMIVNAVPGVVPYPGMYWLPAQMMDSTQDSLLRPPAA